MKNSSVVFAALRKNWFRSKTGVFFSFLFPVMLLLIFGTVFGSGRSQTYTLHVQNLDLVGGEPTELSNTLIKIMNSTGSFEIKNLAADVDITDYIAEHPSFTNYRVLVIPENFQQKAVNKSIYVRTGVILDTLSFVIENYGYTMTENQIGSIENGKNMLEAWRKNISAENAEILLLTDEGDTAAPIVRGIIYSVINTFNNKMIGAEAVVDVSENQLTQRSYKAVDYYLPGYIAAFIMTNGIIGVTSNTSEFRRNGVIKRLTATPLQKSSWIMGNLVHQVLLAFMLMLVMIALGWVIFGVQVIPSPYALALIFMGALVFCSIGMVLGGVLKDVEAATAAGNAIAFPMMFLSGAFWPVEMMPGFMQGVAKCMPLYYFHDGLRQTMIYQNPAQALVPFVILGVLAVVFVYLAIKVTKWKEL
ncbi:MAG: ABC transporter permease [Candidatus Hodarchaeaceae archaeon]|nr:ABC transporter permease [Candidatus Hodarchaeaceae archaeon]